MKYRANPDRIALKDRKAINQICLAALEDDPPSMTPEEVYNKFTGVGGLHGLNYVDFDNYSDFSEAKKEIEQGQFFTSDPVCQWVMDYIRPEYRRRIADLTCGKGSFFNHISNEETVYGCEIDPDSFAVARHCFPKANLTLGDIRTYNPGVRFNVVVGNPPYNLNWTYEGKKMDGQTVYILKAAELLYPGGMLAVIVPETYLGESTRKVDIKRIYERFNHIVQVRIDPNAFAWLGVRNFPTKLLILQRQADSLEKVPFRPEVLPTMEGLRYFQHSHLPEKLTVFGVVQRRQDILNAEVLRELISYTMLTRTFKEVTGKDLERRCELRATMNEEERALYQVAEKEFYRLEREYFKSTNMSARKLAQARIIAQIKIMLRICHLRARSQGLPRQPDHRQDGGHLRENPKDSE